MALVRTREAVHNGLDKNDPKDTQVILHMLRIGLSQDHQDPLAAVISDIQELPWTHELVSNARTETLQRILNHDLRLHFPAIERFRQNLRSGWFFALPEQFPTPVSIVAPSKDAFISSAWDVVGRKVSKARLIADIYERSRYQPALARGDLQLAAGVGKVHGFQHPQAWCPL